MSSPANTTHRGQLTKGAGKIRTIRTLSLLSATILVFSGGGVTEASAAGTSCDASPSFYFDGVTLPAITGIYGVSARIEANDPGLCEVDVSGHGNSSVWTMLLADSIAQPTNDAWDGWAQSGYIQVGSGNGCTGCDGQLRPFSQWTNKCKSVATDPSVPITHCTTNTVTTKYLGILAASGLHDAKSIKQSDGHIHMYFDGGQADVMSYGPGGEWSTSWSRQYEGETHNLADDIAGTPTDQTQFDQIQYYNVGLTPLFVTTDIEHNYHGSDSCAYRYTYYTPDDTTNNGTRAFKIYTDGGKVGDPAEYPRQCGH